MDTTHPVNDDADREPESPVAVDDSSGSGVERHPVESLASQWLQRSRQCDDDVRSTGLRAGRLISKSDAELPDSSPHNTQGEDQVAQQLSDLLPVIKRLEAARRQQVKRPSGLATLGAKRPEQLGDFRIIRQIGRGGMGVVFEAEQISLGRIVAIKVLPQSMLQEDRQVKRFHVEAQLAASLHHTNIVPVFGFGEDAGYHYYVMQRIDGSGLDRVRITGQPLSVELVTKIGKQAAAALHYAHCHGVLHRDVKPANLLLDQDQNLWITDFGVAKAIESVGQTRTNDVVGTLRYMAPEHFLGSANARSDVYSLGCTLYELLAGHPAFNDESIRSALVRRTPVDSAPPVRKVNRSVPTDLETILQKAMATDEADRYQDAGQLADDLERFSKGQPIRARRHSPLELAWRFAKRKPAVASLAAVSLCLLVGIALTASFGYWRNQKLLNEAISSRVSARATAHVATDALDQLFSRFAGDDLLSDISRSYDGEISSDSAITPAVSPETASLLQDLLGYYDRIAKMQASNVRRSLQDSEEELDLQTMESVATAKFHIGSIHWRLGRFYAAANAFKLSLADFRTLDRATGQSQTAPSVVRQVGLLNRIALAHYQLSQNEEAEQYIERALALIQRSPKHIAETPACRFAQARSHYLLGFSLRPGTTADSMPPRVALTTFPSDGRGPNRGPGNSFGNGSGRGPGPGRRPPGDFGRLFDPDFDPDSFFRDAGKPPGRWDENQGKPSDRLGDDRLSRERSREHLAVAADILQRLVSEFPTRPAYALQLAITRREQAVDVLTPEDADAAQQAIAIMEDLQARFPENTQIRWERILTLGDMNVFRVDDDQRRTVGLQRLVQASASLAALSGRYPGINAYVSQRAHLEFKRGVLMRQSSELVDRRRGEEIDYQVSLAFRNAEESCAALVNRVPDAQGYRAWHATFQMWLGDSLRRIGEGTEAVTQLRLARETWTSLDEKSDDPVIDLGREHSEDALVDLLIEAF